MTRRYVSPLRYPGGKAKMAPFLDEVFARQVSQMDIEIWAEPFAGGAGAALTLLDTEAVCEVWLTEKHPAIAALWRTILADPGLADRVEATRVDMALWHWAREMIAEPGGASDLDLGFAALVVNRCSRSGMVTPTSGPIGGKSQDGKWKVDSRWNAFGLAERIRHVHSLRSAIRFTEGDAIESIRSLEDSGIEDELMLFVDPPYIREGNRLYSNGMDEHDHRRLADALNDSPSRWLLTYDDEPVVPESLYPDRRVLAYEIPNTANKARLATEYAVLSPDLHLPTTTICGSEVRWVRDRDVIGNDGLTDAEREEHARRYWEGPGRKTLTPGELEAIARWREEKRKR